MPSKEDIANSIRRGGTAAIAAALREKSDLAERMDLSDEESNNDLDLSNLLNDDGLVQKTKKQKSIDKRVEKKKKKLQNIEEKNAEEDEDILDKEIGEKQNRLLEKKKAKLQKMQKSKNLLSSLASVPALGLVSPAVAGLLAAGGGALEKLDSARSSNLEKSILKLEKKQKPVAESIYKEDKLDVDVPSRSINENDDVLERIYEKQAESIEKLSSIESILKEQKDLEKQKISLDALKEDKDIEKARELSFDRLTPKNDTETETLVPDQSSNLGLLGNIIGASPGSRIASVLGVGGIAAAFGALGSGITNSGRLLISSITGLSASIGVAARGAVARAISAVGGRAALLRLLGRASIVGGAVWAGLNRPIAEDNFEAMDRDRQEHQADPLGFRIRSYLSSMDNALDVGDGDDQQYLNESMRLLENSQLMRDARNAGREGELLSGLESIAQSKNLELESTSRPSPRQNFRGQNLGDVSARYESGRMGVAAISTGNSDPGGVSYGAYQLSSNAGTVQDWMENEGADVARRFGLDGLTPGSEEFNQRYMEAALTNPQEIHRSQEEYIRRTHFDPVATLASERGFDVSNPAIGSALWSQSVQHSLRGNREILDSASSAGSIEDQLRSLQNSRSRYILSLGSLSNEMTSSILDRYNNEYNDLMQIARQPIRSQTLERQSVNLRETSLSSNRTPVVINAPTNVSNGSNRSGSNTIINSGSETDPSIRRLMDSIAMKGVTR